MSGHDHEPKSMGDKYDHDYMARRQVPRYPFISTVPRPTTEEEFSALLRGMVVCDDSKAADGKHLFCLAPADAVWLAYSVGYKLESGKNGVAARLLDDAINQQLGKVLRRNRKITPSHAFIFIESNTATQDIRLVGRPKKDKGLSVTRPYMAAGEQGLSQAVYYGVRFRAPHERLGPEDDEFMMTKLAELRVVCQNQAKHMAKTGHQVDFECLCLLPTRHLPSGDAAVPQFLALLMRHM